MVVGGGGIQAISDTASYEAVNKIVWLSVDVKTEISARTGQDMVTDCGRWRGGLTGT